MYNHEPKEYICPFCMVVNIENEHLYIKQDDIVYKNDYVTAFIASGWWKNNKGHVIIIHIVCKKIRDYYFIKIK